jgi:Co/Zn/Cd efflux system component
MTDDDDAELELDASDVAQRRTLAWVLAINVAQAIVVGMVGLAGGGNALVNLICLRLLRSRRDDGVHLKASWIFTSNDMLANAGIVLSGAAVMLFVSPLPALAIGLVVVGIAVKGGFEILKLARDGGLRPSQAD